MKPPLIYKLLQENPAAVSNPLKPSQPPPYTMKSPLPPHLLPTQQIFSFLSFLSLLLLFSLLLIPSSLKAQNSASYSYQKDYHYDPLGRLSQVQYQSQYQAPQQASEQASEQTTEHRTREPELYRYDAVGNLTYKQIQGEDYHYHYDSAHQLVRMDSPRGSHQYHYDQAGRLIEEEVNGQTQARYQYGYQDKVIAVERDGAITRYEYDAQGNLIAKIDPNGQYELWIWDGITLLARGDERYINQPHASGGLPIVSKTARGIRYHRHDPLGTTLVDYDLDGNRVHIYEYTIYGEGQRAGELESSPSARFTGKPYDVTLAAYVFPYRNYDPITVRWRSSDPIGFPDGPNNHYYAAIPTMQIDPWGLWKLEVSTKVGFPDGKEFQLKENESKIRISLIGEYNVKLTREEGDIGAVAVYFQVQLGKGGVIKDLSDTVSVFENSNYSSVSGSIDGFKELGVGSHSFGVRVLLNYGGSDLRTHPNRALGNFKIKSYEK